MSTRGWRFIIALIIIVVLASGALPVGSTSPTDASVTTVEGVSITVGAAEEQELLDDMQEYTDRYPVSPADHAFYVMTEETTWVVFADEEPEIGEATVDGFTIGPADGTGVIFANSVAVDTSTQQVSASDLAATPDQYSYQTVEVSGYYRQMSYTADAGEGSVRKQSTVGAVSSEPFDIDSPIRQPGQSARWAVLNLSETSPGWTPEDEINSHLITSGRWVSTINAGQHEWWINGTATVTGVVLTRPVGAPPDENSLPHVYVQDVQPESQQIGGADAVADRGDQLEGEVVSFETQLVGTTTSSKGQLLEMARCAPDTVAVPAGCGVPVVTDSALHAGVLFDGLPESRSDIVMYAGISNEKVSQVRSQRSGTYEVTGRVVNSAEIDPRLPEGYALLVYDMERTGGLKDSSSESAGREHSDETNDRMHSQMNSSESEWNEAQSQRTRTATARSTATATGATQETAEPTPSPADPALTASPGGSDSRADQRIGEEHLLTANQGILASLFGFAMIGGALITQLIQAIIGLVSPNQKPAVSAVYHLGTGFGLMIFIFGSIYQPGLGGAEVLVLVGGFTGLWILTTLGQIVYRMF